MIQKQISINGQLLSYRELFPQRGGKPPCYTLLILHGWGSESAHWQKIMNALEKKNIRIIALDFPGFGASPVPPDTWSLQNYTDLTDAFIQKLGLRNVVLLGHSFGGRVIISLAPKEPSYIQKIILVGAAGIEQKSTKTKIKSFVSKIVRPLFQPKWMQGIRRKVYEFIGSGEYLDRPELSKIFGRVIAEDLTPLLAKNTYETLLIWGENDISTPLWHGELMAKEMSNATLEVIPGCGHYVFLDNPEVFLDTVLSFLLAKKGS